MSPNMCSSTSETVPVKDPYSPATSNVSSSEEDTLPPLMPSMQSLSPNREQFTYHQLPGGSEVYVEMAGTFGSADGSYGKNYPVTSYEFAPGYDSSGQQQLYNGFQQDSAPVSAPVYANLGNQVPTSLPEQWSQPPAVNCYPDPPAYSMTSLQQQLPPTTTSPQSGNQLHTVFPSYETEPVTPTRYLKNVLCSLAGVLDRNTVCQPTFTTNVATEQMLPQRKEQSCPVARVNTSYVINCAELRNTQSTFEPHELRPFQVLRFPHATSEIKRGHEEAERVELETCREMSGEKRISGPENLPDIAIKRQKESAESEQEFVNKSATLTPPPKTPAETTPSAKGRVGKRPRTAYTSHQLMALENTFKESKYIQRGKRIEVSERLCLTERQVKVWFQNRRMKEKKDDAKKGSSSNQSPQSPSSSTSSPPLPIQGGPHMAGSQGQSVVTSQVVRPAPHLSSLSGPSIAPIGQLDALNPNQLHTSFALSQRLGGYSLMEGDPSGISRNAASQLYQPYAPLVTYPYGSYPRPQESMAQNLGYLNLNSSEHCDSTQLKLEDCGGYMPLAYNFNSS